MLVVGGRGEGPGHTCFDIATGSLGRDQLGSDPIAPGPEVHGSRFPDRQRGPLVLPDDGRLEPCLAVCGRGLEGGHGFAQPERLALGSLGLADLPGGFTGHVLRRSAGRTLGLVRRTPSRGRIRLMGPSRVQSFAGRSRGGGGLGRETAPLGGLGLGGGHVELETLQLGPTLERTLGVAQGDGDRSGQGAPVASDRRPARRQVRLHLEQAGQVGYPGNLCENPPGGPQRVAPDGVDEEAATERIEAIGERGIRLLGIRRSGFVDDDGAPFGGQSGHRPAFDQVGPRHLAQRRLHRGAEDGLHVELLVEPPPADPARRPGDAAGLFLGQPGTDRLEAPAQTGDARARRGGRFSGRPGRPVGAVQRSAGDITICDCPALGLTRIGGALRCGNAILLEPCSLGGRPIGVGSLLGDSTLSLDQAPAGSLQLGQSSRLGASHRCQLVTLRLSDGSQPTDFLERLGQPALCLRDGRLETGVGSGQRQGGLAATQGEVGLGSGAFGLEALPVAPDRGQVRSEARLAEPELGVRRSRDLVGLAPQPFGFCPGSKGRRQGRCGCLGLGQLSRRPVCVRAGPGQPLGRGPVSGRRLVPAAVGRSDEGRSQLVTGRGTGDLLLGLGGQAAGLRSQLGQDVVDPREIALGLGQLLLGLAPATLVAADAGDLLEQRSTFLGSEGQGLVHHALADEQEGIVGEVGRVEQLDQVAQADPLLVEEVVVLTGAVQATAELEDAVLDREQAIGVVEHEGHVRHAQGGPPVRTCEDHVFALTAAQRPALLAEGPAQGVGKVALSGAVGTDDRADPRPELDDGALGERLETLEPKCKQPGRRAHAEAGVLTRWPSRAGRAGRPPRRRSRLTSGSGPPRRQGPGRRPTPLPGRAFRDPARSRR